MRQINHLQPQTGRRNLYKHVFKSAKTQLVIGLPVYALLSSDTDWLSRLPFSKENTNQPTSPQEK